MSKAPRRRAFNADLDDSFGGGGGFWGDEREDEGFDARDAEQFVNVMNNDRFGERRDGVALDDLGWPDLDDDFDDLQTLAPRPDDINRPASSASASSSPSSSRRVAPRRRVRPRLGRLAIVVSPGVVSPRRRRVQRAMVIRRRG